MKTILKAALILAGMMPLAAVAQTDAPQTTARAAKAEKMEMRTDRLVTDLGLNEKQAAQVKEINDRTAKEIADRRAAEAAGQPHQYNQDISQRRDEALKKVLTGAQYKRMMELREERKGGAASTPPSK